jgi:hypothetical protein
LGEVEGFMALVPRYTLRKNEKSKKWELVRDQTNKVIQTFNRKAEATAAGNLEKAIGGEGSVKIVNRSGKLTGERTYHRIEKSKS